jgi:aldose 1-epimerase
MIGFTFNGCRRAWLALILAVPMAAGAANYSTRRTMVDSVEVVTLSDAARQTEVSFVPTRGNVIFEMKVKGKNILPEPAGPPVKISERKSLNGIPFMGPWANRLDQLGYYANGEKYLLNPDLKNFGIDQFQHPLHGLLTGSSAWKVASLTANAQSAAVTTRLEFWKYPDLMAQFPFAHTIELTYRLRDGVLEVETVLKNLSNDPMPVSIGFHPCFELHDAPRDQWKLHLPARDQMVLSAQLLPTGERKPVTFADPLPLAGVSLDDVFTNLVRGADGRSETWVEGAKQRVTVISGPKFPTAVVYVPKGSNSACVEPMAAITDALNLSQKGLYKELQSIAPGGEWRETFWVRPSGF